MPWFYVDDGFSDSKPVMAMPDRHRLAACGLWVLAGSWSAKEETDGFVPDAKLRQLRSRPNLIDVLTESSPTSDGLCTKVVGGIQFNSWSKWQKTRAELVEKRHEAAERQRNSRCGKRKGRNAVTSSDSEMSQCDSRVTDSVTEESVTHPVTRDPHARARRPDPTRPDPTRSSSGYLSGGVAQVAATEPPLRCSRHMNHDNPPNCIACRDARVANEAWHAGELDRRRQARAAAVAIADNCPICHGTKWIPDTEPAVKCDHQEVS